MKVYISIPISGHDYGKQKAYANLIKKKFEEVGAEVVTPFEVAPETDKPYSYYMGLDIEALLDCDAVYFCPGYELSRGCRLEYSAALTFDKFILKHP